MSLLEAILAPFLSLQTYLEDPIYTQHARKGHLQADTARFGSWRVNYPPDPRKRLYGPKKGLLAGLGVCGDLQKDAKRPKRGYRIGGGAKKYPSPNKKKIPASKDMGS